MRTISYTLLVLILGYTSFTPLAIAGAPSAEVLLDILKSQGVTEKSALDCSSISDKTAELYGEAFFTEMVDTESPEYQAILTDFPSEKRAEIFRGMGLQNLGCITSGEVGIMPLGVEDQYNEEGRAVIAEKSMRPLSVQSGMRFFAAWATLLWLFSALGFAVFMVWITSSKFRFLFRKMAEGEYDKNEKAMAILKERFARGEVTKEQFDRTRRDILN